MRLVFLCVLVLCAVLALISDAHAQTPAASGTEDVIVPVKKGAVAPFSGQLFDNKTALRWGLWLRDYKDLSAAELLKVRGLCDSDLQLKDDLLKIEQDKTVTITTDLQKKLLESETTRVKLQDQVDHPPWYDNFWFHFGIGAVSTVAVVLVAHQAF
jgi:hypothetical protein